MSVGPTAGPSTPDPAAYTYTPALPSGIANGAAPSSASSSPAPSPYAAEYRSLQQQDAAELLQVSLASPAAAAANVESVLAQAAALQHEQPATQPQQTAITAPVTPTFDEVANASNGAANAAIGAYVNGGSAIDLLA